MRRCFSKALLSLVLPGMSLGMLSGCGEDEMLGGEHLVLRSDQVELDVDTRPFGFEIRDANGKLVLASLHGASGDAFGAPAATVDDPIYGAEALPGWDGYTAQEGPWRHATSAEVLEQDDHSLTLALGGNGVNMSLGFELDGSRVRLHLAASEHADATAQSALNKTTLAFRSDADEHFFGMGERFATVDHRGFELYSWPEEGALGKGESTPPGPNNPFPNGPSMTYFPVPFFLSSRGYAVHLATTYRTEIDFAAARPDAWRFAVNATDFSATVYVHADPLKSIDEYTADTGRPVVPPSWDFGVSRRVDIGAMVDGVPEWQAMRDHDIACTSIDDSTHFLPALSQLGRENELEQWTATLHAAGYKAIAYNNPYVAEDNPNAQADYAFGVDHGYFVLGPDGKPTLTQFISGKLLTVAAVDFTNPDAVTWYQGLLQRTLDLGYDGWMHDFGEYTPRDAVFFDGRRGDEMHNAYPVLSAKAAHDLLEKERPGDYLFFVRSGGSGSSQYAPMVWQGDAEATFDETLGLPSALRAGVDESISGVPYFGSDMTGFKCITNAPNDKEVFLRWVEFGAVSPFMHEENACSNPLGGGKTKWKLWNDDETIQVYARYAKLHTRLQPYLLALAEEAHATGKPIVMHPFLVHPEAPESYGVDDAFYFGPALYALPVVRRGELEKTAWLPPGRYFDLDDATGYQGGSTVTIPAPLDKLPLLLVADQILPMLDASIDTLAPATDPTVVTPDDVADRLDAVVALTPGGHATFTLADGTVLDATRLASDAGNPGSLAEVAADAMTDCSACFHAEPTKNPGRVQVNSALAVGSDLTLGDLHLVVEGGPARRVRWDLIEP